MRRAARRKSLTQIAVDQWRPADTRVEVADPGKRGLYLIIQPSGVKSWAVRYRRQADAMPRKYTIEGFPSIGTARKLAQVVLDQVAEGRDPAATKQIDKEAARAKAAGDHDTFGVVARKFITRSARPNNR